VRGALNVLLPVIAIAALSLGSAPSLNAQATDPNTTYAGSVNDAIQSVRAVVDAAGNVGVVGTRANNCVALPLTLVGESLPNLDNSGASGSGTLVVSRAISTSSVITAEFINATTGLPLPYVAPQFITVTANNTNVLSVSWRTLLSWGGLFMRLRIIVDGQTVMTTVIEMV
jgi:hypothetical protein